MARQVHGIMQDAQDIQNCLLFPVIAADPEQQEVTPFSAKARNVQSEQAFGDLIARLRTGSVRASLGQRLHRGGQSVRICSRLRLTKPILGPAQNTLDVGLSARRDTNRPATRPHPLYFERPVDALPEMTPSVSDVR